MLTYDIDDLRSSSGTSAKLLLHLWDLWKAEADDNLLPEERIVRDAWIYDTANGNGLCDMLVNERYAELSAGLRALRELNSPKLDLYVARTSAAFYRVGIDCFDSESIETAICRCKPLFEDLKVAEEPFLQHLWDGAIIVAAQDYIERHLDAFRTRATSARATGSLNG